MESKTVTESQALLAHWMGPNDANGSGNIHGGTVMKLIDEVAGGRRAQTRAPARIVTASVDSVTFLVPLYVGDDRHLQGQRQRRLAHLDGGRDPGRGREPGDRRDPTLQHRLRDVRRARRERPARAEVSPLIAETPRQERRMSEAQLRRQQPARPSVRRFAPGAPRRGHSWARPTRAIRPLPGAESRARRGHRCPGGGRGPPAANGGAASVPWLSALALPARPQPPPGGARRQGGRRSTRPGPRPPSPHRPAERADRDRRSPAAAHRHQASSTTAGSGT